MTAAQAIASSISHNEIVHLEWSAQAEEELAAACDDSVEAFGCHEFWGRDAAGDEWRVHLDNPRKSPFADEYDSPDVERADYERDRDIDDEITGGR